mmetsp:Transcript_103769/g.302892  ORF Transcript_103769/g.302892 Transcript_103769/m.302892 type:complete len:316 (-) Transcript_103769:540-1487(-)
MPAFRRGQRADVRVPQGPALPVRGRPDLLDAAVPRDPRPHVPPGQGLHGRGGVADEVRVAPEPAGGARGPHAGLLPGGQARRQGHAGAAGGPLGRGRAHGDRAAAPGPPAGRGRGGQGDAAAADDGRERRQQRPQHREHSLLVLEVPRHGGEEEAQSVQDGAASPREVRHHSEQDEDDGRAQPREPPVAPQEARPEGLRGRRGRGAGLRRGRRRAGLRSDARGEERRGRGAGGHARVDRLRRRGERQGGPAPRRPRRRPGPDRRAAKCGPRGGEEPPGPGAGERRAEATARGERGGMPGAAEASTRQASASRPAQ